MGAAQVVSIFDRREVSRDLEPWRSKAWIAVHFEVSTRTVERWVARGGPRETLHDGGLVRFRLSEVEGWLRADA
jgi:excisionase family DNA binding protein